jgi:predicted transcriptional regulator
MKQVRKRQLESKGYRVGDTQEFLCLTDEESAYIETKVLLAKSLRKLRKSKRISQTEMAKLLGSSQSRVAKMEAGDPSVSTDLLFKGMFALGATRKDIGRVLASRKAA